MNNKIKTAIVALIKSDHKLNLIRSALESIKGTECDWGTNEQIVFDLLDVSTDEDIREMLYENYFEFLDEDLTDELIEKFMSNFYTIEAA